MHRKKEVRRRNTRGLLNASVIYTECILGILVYVHGKAHYTFFLAS